MFSNVIIDIAFPRRSFVFGQSSCEVSASLTDVGGAAVGAIILYTAPFLFLGSSWQDGKRVHCKYLPLSHTKP